MYHKKEFQKLVSCKIKLILGYLEKKCITKRTLAQLLFHSHEDHTPLWSNASYKSE